MTASRESDEYDGSSVSRRSYLQLIGASTGAFALNPVPSQAAWGSVKYRGIQFDSAVDLVEDYGADPTGDNFVDNEVTAAAKSDTLIKVPEGEYQFSDGVALSPNKFPDEVYQLSLLSPGNLGFLARDGTSPRFVAPDGYNDSLLTINGVSRALFEGIDIDYRPTNTTAGLKLGTDDGFHIQDVEFIGRGTHPDSELPNALTLTVKNSSGRGVVRNVVAKNGSAIGHYKGGNGRTGAFVGRTTNGTVRFEDCQFEEFGNNGLYVSRTRGNVEVVGGIYRNNNVAGVRIAGDGSFVKDATVEIDLRKYTGPTTGQDTAYSTRGIVIDAGDIHQTPGARVENCDVIYSKTDHTNGAVCVQAWDENVDQELIIENSRIEVNDDVTAVYSEGGPVHVRYSCIEGSAEGEEAIRLNGELASGSTISGTCIDQTGKDRVGVTAKAADCSIAYSNIDVTGEPFVELNGGTISTSNVTFDESCATSPAMEERRRYHLFNRLLRRVGIHHIER